jgi:hypothetical protein
MNKVVKAEVNWVPIEAGGRKSPPPGPRYITVARFEDDKDKYPKEAWSLVLEFSDLPNDSLSVVADVRFLAEDAPVQLLHKGSMFELYEGHKLVATGKVL